MIILSLQYAEAIASLNCYNSTVTQQICLKEKCYKDLCLGSLIFQILESSTEKTDIFITWSHWLYENLTNLIYDYVAKHEQQKRFVTDYIVPLFIGKEIRKNRKRKKTSEQNIGGLRYEKYWKFWYHQYILSWPAKGKYTRIHNGRWWERLHLIQYNHNIFTCFCLVTLLSCIVICNCLYFHIFAVILS